MRNINLLKEELPQEKMMNLGPQNLTNVELLAIILRTGTKEKNVLTLSREILSKFYLDSISRKSYNEFLKFKGISRVKACQIVSIFELARRLSYTKNKNKFQINEIKDVINLTKTDFSNLKKEIVLAIFIDTKNNLIRKEIISIGAINYSIIEPRDLLKKVFDYDASGFLYQ
jgi:DNA repair protein RadC